MTERSRLRRTGVPRPSAAAGLLVLGAALLVPGGALLGRDAALLLGVDRTAVRVSAGSVDAAPEPVADPLPAARPRGAAPPSSASEGIPVPGGGAPAAGAPVVEARSVPPAGPVPTLAPPPSRFAPQALRVPAVGLAVPVVPVEVTDSVLGLPEDPAVLGWWADGAAPAQGSGSVVLAGHLDSAEHGRGPLGAVVDLRVGDAAAVTGTTARGGTRERTYRVVAVRTYLKERLPAAELFAQDGPERLVLVTCGGQYRRAHGGWDSNVVVILEPEGA